ncbi:MAG: hypothetical protein DMG13_33710 [Acidobacteria bacterium]|nr:MAG: hypothetical protein DMG13_33710 [Acidobacteriota bacterium]
MPDPTNFQASFFQQCFGIRQGDLLRTCITSFPHLYGRTAKIFRLFETGIPGSEIEHPNAFGIFLNNQSCSFPDSWLS